MKALSVRNPWANDIVYGVKTVEWRSWYTNYRGPLLICSTAKPDPRYREFCKPYKDYDGKACGIVTLYDCVPFGREHLKGALAIGENDDPNSFPLSEISGYAWLLKDASLIDAFPVKGKQGFMNITLPPDVTCDRPDLYQW